jgi:hypothetical protein
MEGQYLPVDDNGHRQADQSEEDGEYAHSAQSASILG